MVAPRWNRMVLRVHATQECIYHCGPALEPCVFTCPGHPKGVSNMVVPSWNHVFHVSRPPKG
eukprot:6902291-Pyramimonas_sp.AAC.1